MRVTLELIFRLDSRRQHTLAVARKLGLMVYASTWSVNNPIG